MHASFSLLPALLTPSSSIDQYHCFIPPDQAQRENMNLKDRLAVTVAILAVMAVAFAPSAYAQTTTTRTDQASYTPGGTGTLYITVVNNSPTDTLEIRNLKSVCRTIVDD